MIRKIRIRVVDRDTNINFALPLGLVTRLLRVGVDVFALFVKDVKINSTNLPTKDLKLLAEFFEGLKHFEPFTFVEVEDRRSHVLIRME